MKNCFSNATVMWSERTIDWHIDGLEVAGCSVRKDWPHGMVFEIAIGLDRLVALQMANEPCVEAEWRVRHD